MRKEILLLLILFLIPFVYSEWTYNPFTDKLDYYIPASGSSGGNPFNQWLNTTDNPTFNNITATEYFIGDGSLITGITGSSYNSSYEYWTNESLTSTYNSTYDSKPNNVYNSSYEYWTNSSLTDVYNSSYEYWDNSTLTDTYNSTYDLLKTNQPDSGGGWKNTSNLVSLNNQSNNVSIGVFFIDNTNDVFNFNSNESLGKFLVRTGSNETHQGVSGIAFGGSSADGKTGDEYVRMYVNGSETSGISMSISPLNNGTISFGDQTFTGGYYFLGNPSTSVLLIQQTIYPYAPATSNLGTATNYFNTLNYKNAVDRGCLGSFDDGVELINGTTVSDMDALKSIQVRDDKETVYGVPMLDYRTMPKAVYYPASDINGKLYERDKQTNEPLPFNKTYDNGDVVELQPQDGAEMSALISIMIGALKEKDAEIHDLENRIKLLEERLK